VPIKQYVPIKHIIRQTAHLCAQDRLPGQLVGENKRLYFYKVVWTQVVGECLLTRYELNKE